MRGGVVTRLSGAERCRACRARRLERMRRDPADPLHGTVTGYSYGCRCERCREARHEAYLAYKPRKRELYDQRRRIDGGRERRFAWA